MNSRLALYEQLKHVNPELAFFHCFDAEFHRYGMVLQDFDASPIIAMVKRYPFPPDGVEYIRTISELERNLPLSFISQHHFNGADLQAGICHGYNNRLNALEWHPSNEMIIAASNAVLLLGHCDDMRDYSIDVSNIRAFFVPEKTALVLYSSTLHFAPLHAQKNGFRAIIILPKLTNAPFDEANPKPTDDVLLFATNKCMIAHSESPQAAKGAHVGIIGNNLSLHIPE